MKFLVFLAIILLASPAMAAERCGGRYQAAAEMVDAAMNPYDTLYSGGGHWHQLDHVGATLDLYRLWRGLPDLGLRRLNSRQSEAEIDVPILEAGSAPEIVREALDRVERPQEMSESQSADLRAAIILDLATSVSTPADWWRQPNIASHRTGVQNALAPLAAQRALFDWLQTIIAASDTPWSLAWHLDDSRENHRPEYDRLIADALSKVHAGGGIEWAVAAQLFWYPGTMYADRLLTIAKDWESRVLKCEASAAEYAAYAAGAAVAGRHTGVVADQERIEALPSTVRSVLLRNTAMTAMARGNAAKAAETLKALSVIDSDPDFRPWLNIARAYTATSIEELIEIFRGQDLDAKSFRVLNLLSLENLQRVDQAGALSGDGEIALLQSIFARHVALGHTDTAAALLGRIREKVAARGWTDYVGAVESSLPNDVAMALVVSRTPRLSLWMTGAMLPHHRYYDAGLELFDSHNSRELPTPFSDGRAIQSDFETWLLLPQKWYRFRGMHGMSWGALERNYHNRNKEESTAVPAPAIFNAKSDFGIARLAALDEIAQLQGDRRLNRQVSLTLLRWAGAASDTWVKRLMSNGDLAAEALHRVVMLNRYDSGGDLDGVPLGKRAFTLLYKRFPRSDWTKKTPYWYKGRQIEH